MPHFSDETLFMIFYTQTRDIIQEFAAAQLYVTYRYPSKTSLLTRFSRTERNWRFHTDLKMWLTKDMTLPEPIQLTSEKEQGSYVFFNHMAWEKVRVRKSNRFLPYFASVRG